MALDGSRLLGDHEHDVVRAITDEAYAYLLTNPLQVGSALEPTGTPYEIGSARLCPEASDVATRTAQKMGLIATREITSRFGRSHAYTSFAPLDSMPSDDDLILCLTWGQFVGEKKYAAYVDKHADQDYPGYFGRRADIPRPYKKDNNAIEESFRFGNVAYRQTTFCFPKAHTLFASWLRTTPSDVSTGIYQMGEVDPSAHPPDQWMDLY